MMDSLSSFLGFIVGLFVTLFVGAALLNSTKALHRFHVEKYLECVKIGAPVQNCIDTYLLDKTL